MERKELLPKWIRFFSWIYLLLFITPLVFLLGLSGVAEVSFMLFGLSYEGTTSLHPIPVWITIVGTLAAAVGYGILWGKDWALRTGIVYGWIALGTCVVAVYLKLQEGTLYIPFEPLLLIPFMIVLAKKRKEWNKFVSNGKGEESAQPGSQQWTDRSP